MSERQGLTLLSPDFAFTRGEGGYFRHLNEGHRQNLVMKQREPQGGGDRARQLSGRAAAHSGVFLTGEGASRPLLRLPALS